MKKFSLLIMIMLALICARAENLVRNGDFSEGVNGWYGKDLSVQKLNGNDCLKIRPNKRDVFSLDQTFQLTEKFRSYTVSLKYKTSDNYSGDGIEISALPTDVNLQPLKGVQSARRTFALEQANEWTSLSWNINFESSLTDCAKMRLKLQTQPGQGIVYLDEIEMSGSNSRLETINPEPEDEEPEIEVTKSDSKPKTTQLETLPENHTDNL